MKSKVALTTLLATAYCVRGQECAGEPGTCAAPSLTELVSDGPKAHENGRLGQCQGDCDKDAHCKIGLKCFQRDSLEPVPGCEGSGEYGYDYCVVPELTGDDPKAHLNGPLGMCKGDCDHDDHCADGLICYQREGLDAVPGCAGSGAYGFSYCTLPTLDSEGGMKAHDEGPIGLCAGDCDIDAHCADGLVCHERDGFDPVPGCQGPGAYDYDYCVLPSLHGLDPKEHAKGVPLKICQGDCDKDAHCEGGLVCHQRDGFEHVPGCEGEGMEGFDYCALPQLVDFGPRAHQNGPLGLCQGDCDIDSHCAEGLVCFQREGTTHVPGCGGAGQYSYSYCIRPPLSGEKPNAHVDGPLGMCEGDCDSSEHCADGLMCYKREGINAVPDCYGYGLYGFDYCTRPALVSKGPNAHVFGELGLCEGDCDVDDHCAKGLTCFKREAFAPVPGCNGEGEYDYSYCHRPPLKSIGTQAHKNGKLRQCEGDCDIDSHCADGLKCFQRKAFEPVPNCLGQGLSGWSYCTVE